MRDTGCFARSILTGAATISSPPQAGDKVDKSRLTEVGRALKQLGIIHIAAYSPEARGRSERMFGTLQDRLVNELRLKRIAEIGAANQYL